MRISVPTIPHALSAPSTATKPIDTREAIDRIARFLAPGNVTLVTGAGVSVDSGIRAYRGSNGRYLNPNYKPIFYHELMDRTDKGAAYRLRSYLGYKSVRDSQPNTTHFALAALQYKSIIPRLITQNVDGLHHKSMQQIWNKAQMENGILELHGSLHKVHCTHGHVVDRNVFQDWLSSANPRWKAFADALEASGQGPRTNPDGDVVLEGVSYDDFVVPDCPVCLQEGRKNNVQKPELIFFGESIQSRVKDLSYQHIDTCDRLFLVGTTLATFSAFRYTHREAGSGVHYLLISVESDRLLKHALELQKPVLMLNIGPTRADGLPGMEKIEIASGIVMRDVVRQVLGFESISDTVVNEMLRSGVVQPPREDD
ncbi:hypothetical protein NLI96_g7498 [Meripilus lineatus]|uniref:Deacetylase sirtuin-type domain-containing protein n=1 Tax=Meripilus lineatus TaxID=2056292 RepID=A0AAD5V0Q8_9APHY|nr:hypothetical protein NLI96_g7498 [Physisporinus lineatus]